MYEILAIAGRIGLILGIILLNFGRTVLSAMCFIVALICLVSIIVYGAFHKYIVPDIIKRYSEYKKYEQYPDYPAKISWGMLLYNMKNSAEKYGIWSEYGPFKEQIMALEPIQ